MKRYGVILEENGGEYYQSVEIKTPHDIGITGPNEIRIGDCGETSIIFEEDICQFVELTPDAVLDDWYNPDEQQRNKKELQKLFKP